MDKKIEGKLLKKGERIRPKSIACARENLLITNNIKTDSIQEIEEELIDLIFSLNIESCNFNIEKEILISSVNDSDQFGFEISNKLLNILAKNNFKLCVSGVFV